MTQHILLPLDGSRTSTQATTKAVAQAKAFGAAVTAVYVIDPYPFTGVGADVAYGQAQYMAAATAEATQVMEGARQAIEAAGVVVHTRVVEAHSVWRGILDTAQEVGADMVVIGSHGRSGIEKLVLGSVAQSVVSHARVPVLVVRG